MDPFQTLVPLIPALPLAGAATNGLLGRRLGRTAVTAIAAGAVGLAFALAVTVFAAFAAAEIGVDAGSVVVRLFPWIHAGPVAIDVAFHVDPLALVLTCVITGVGFLIHLYSHGYMHEDPGYARYFAYLNLFVFAMLVLVLGSSLPLLFLGWEGVGLCSYLLIGFWFDDLDKARAGRKAFVVNRIGDVAFALGMLWLFHATGVLDFEGLAAAFGNGEALPVGLDEVAVTAIGLLLFAGACGKSAQIPLYVWLPDAMAGPTPVSALIHAATMVTAGVYLIARLSFLYALAPFALTVVACVGAATALFSGTIALAQNDIKKVLAYSTVSQLGYMFLAVGVGAYAAGIFHLVTHAFFKALLFLGAGSVIHALGGEQDLRRMGGLRTEIPTTWLTFTIGAAAIAGIPPLAGFVSKEEILGAAFGTPNPIHHDLPVVLGGIGLAAAGLTALYTGRLWWLTFHGESRVPDDVKAHVHESPRIMTGPLAFLAVLSATGGALALGPLSLEHVLEPSLTPPAWVDPHGDHGHAALSHAALLGISVALAAGGVAGAWLLYGRRRDWLVLLGRPLEWLRIVLEHKYWVDEIYEVLIIRPIGFVARWGHRLIDAGLVDGIVNGAARSTLELGRATRRWSSGNAHRYAAWIFAGTLALLAGVVLRHEGITLDLSTFGF